jgi:predicted nuclease of predicted toxin-antitoxin system
MNLWLDAQLSPRLARWIDQQFPGVTASALRDVGLRDAEDAVIFEQARTAGVIVMTKDRDFVDLQHRLGSPPKIIWLTCGNTSEAALQANLTKHLQTALGFLAGSDDLVEISGP